MEKKAKENTINKNQGLSTSQNTKRAIVIGVVLILIGLIALILPEYFIFQRLIGGIIFLTGVLLILNIYLNEGFEKNGKIYIGQGASSNVIINNTDGSFLTQEIIQKISDNEEGKFIEILDFIEKFKNRLKMHIETLSRNGNLNLLIGLGTTIVAVCILTYFIFGEKELPKEMPALMAHYISRISIVIFIEIFALFFLRLYRTNLFEIKFFHNELSNFEAKIIALKTALYVKQTDTINEVIKEIARTERNFIIKSGETTLELERAKIDKDDKQSFVDNLVKILEKSKQS
jgi:hypothetical protein